ncbi:IPT/TIG domain-containing protein [Larkinella rosea]|uniref:Uncharacterized protein n=1 Tax=Larkinella rosea TaxID=2025312 RepID=A0A3P1BP55_9BACT|nr:IPT/TIG domain-containing protein [Larkinella rosea]RRB02842.1 hypothetical protein EHT25_20605 [Larkinella rosea]
MRRVLLLLLPVLILLTRCERKDPLPTNGAILAFGLENISTLKFSLDSTDRTIQLVVPYRTDLKRRRPVIRISDGCRVVPAAEVEQDFTKPVLYTLIAPDGRLLVYRVVVTSEIQPQPVIQKLETDTLEAGFPFLITGHHFGDFPLDVSAELLDSKGESHSVSNQYLDSTRLRLSVPLSLEPGPYAIRVRVKSQAVVSSQHLQITYPAPQLIAMPRRNLRQGDTLLLTSHYADPIRYRFSVLLSNNAKKWALPLDKSKEDSFLLPISADVLPGIYEVVIQNDTEKKQSRQTDFLLRVYDRNQPFVTGLKETTKSYRKGSQVTFQTTHFEAFSARFYQIQLQGAARSYAVNGIYQTEKKQLTVELPATMTSGLYRVSIVLIRDETLEEYRIDLDAMLTVSD